MNYVPPTNITLTTLEQRSLNEATEQYPSFPPDLIADIAVLFHNSRTKGAGVIGSIAEQVYWGCGKQVVSVRGASTLALRDNSAKCVARQRRLLTCERILD